MNLDIRTLLAWTGALFLAAVLFPHTEALRLILLLGGTVLAGIWLVSAKARGEYLSIEFLPPLVVPIATWSAWATASIAWSMAPAMSLKELQNEIGYAFLAFWFCYCAAQTRAASRAIPLTVILSSIAACMLGLLAFWFPSVQLTLGKFNSGAGDQTSALLTLMPCVLVGVWLAEKYETPRHIKAFIYVLPVLFIASAYTTLNRTVWMGFSAEILILGTFYLGRPNLSEQRSRMRNPTFVLLASTLVMMAGAAMVLRTQDERVTLEMAHEQFSHDPRLALWSWTIELIKERPLLGYGFGRGIIREQLHEEFEARGIWHPHNLFLGAAVELGLPGLIFLLLLLAATAREGWRLARDADAVAAGCGAALVAIVMGMLIRNMTDILWVRQNALLYWGVVGSVLGWGRANSLSDLRDRNNLSERNDTFMDLS